MLSEDYNKLLIFRDNHLPSSLFGKTIPQRIFPPKPQDLETQNKDTKHSEIWLGLLINIARQKRHNKKERKHRSLPAKRSFSVLLSNSLFFFSFSLLLLSTDGPRPALDYHHPLNVSKPFICVSIFCVVISVSYSVNPLMDLHVSRKSPTSEGLLCLFFG